MVYCFWQLTYHLFFGVHFVNLYVILGDLPMDGIGIENSILTSQLSFLLQGLCHISELSSDWLAKPEDVRTYILCYYFHKSLSTYHGGFEFSVVILCQAFKVGDRFDVKLIEV